ncbi:hypothetical protein ACSSS7_003298 [Eimeria intestinalis]
MAEKLPVCQHALWSASGNAYGFTVVPLYDTLGPHSTRFILEETQMKSVVCDDSCLGKLLDALREVREEDAGENNPLPVKFLIALDEIPEALKKQAADMKLDLIPWEVLLETAGRQAEAWSLNPTKSRIRVVSLASKQRPALVVVKASSRPF